jgi:hypothetical protein
MALDRGASRAVTVPSRIDHAKFVLHEIHHDPRAAWDNPDRTTVPAEHGAGRHGGSAMRIPSSSPFRVGSRLLIVIGAASLPPVAAARPPATRAIPDVFVENLGQFDERAAFVAQVDGAAIFATAEGLRLALSRPDGALALFVTLDTDTRAGRGKATVTPFESVPGEHHFLLGSDPARWVTGARGFRGIAYRDVHPGVDLVVTTRDGALTLDLAIDPGTAGELPAFRIEGATGLRVVADGSLVVATEFGEFAITRPLSAASRDDGTARALPSHWEVEGRDRARIVVSRAPPGEAILVDPDLVFATLLGGTGSGNDEFLHAVAVDAGGSAFVAGTTLAPDFPVTAGAYDASPNGLRDAFVTKFSPDGDSLVYSTRLGGTHDDFARALALGTDGAAFVGGSTHSANFPTTPGAVDPIHSSLEEGFVARLAPAGDALLHSTFLGGTKNDSVLTVAVDALGNAFVGGTTNSQDFPVTPGAYDTVNLGFNDAFVAKILETGTAFGYSTLLGASGTPDSARGIAIGEHGEAFVTGSAGLGFPFTQTAYDPSLTGTIDAFVVRLNASGSGLVAGTFLGATGSEVGNGIAIGPDGSVTVCGEGAFLGFPATPGAFDPQPSPSFSDAFVARFDGSLGSLRFATFLGGDDVDTARSVAVDASGAAIVTGSLANTSPGFPTTPGAFNTTLGHSFLTRFTPDGSELAYSTFIAYGSEARALAIDDAGGAHVVGSGGGPTFPATAGAFDTTPDGPDGWLARFDLCAGSATSYGSGCAGSGGFVPQLAIAGCPSSGFTLAIGITETLGHAPGLLLLGLGTGTLPVSPSCSIDIAPLLPAVVLPIALFGSGPGGGALSFEATLPAIAGLPIMVHLQALISDPNAGSGVAATNAVMLTIAE